MHMTFHTYRTIKRSLMQTLHARVGSHQEQHINTLAVLICGIVRAQHVQFAQIADHAPLRGRKNESLIGRFRRWVKHKAVTPEAIWLPFARSVLASLAQAREISARLVQHDPSNAVWKNDLAWVEQQIAELS